ncbi:MAG: flippase-like domain-containing protein [Deltaproteobacteria bacterium]|nr:flippase-like domain-containing protein [Deltaproteobacteria bacterium]
MNPESWHSNPFRSAILAGGSFAIGIFLLIGLCSLYSIQIGDVEKILHEINLSFAVLIFASTFFHFWITGVKWRIVTQKITSISQTNTNFFLYSSLTGLLSQAIPLQFCVLFVRTLATRWHDNLSLKKGAASAVYDQFFDLLIPLLILGPGLLYIFNAVDKMIFVVITSILFLILLLFISFAGEQIIIRLLKFGALLPYVGTHLKKKVQDLQINNREGILAPGTIAIIFFLSLIRYINLLLRYYVVSLAIGADISFFQVTAAMPAIHLSIILPITPAGLGVAEWGWVGILSFMGTGLDDATSFALFARILVFISVVTVCTIAYLFAIVFRRTPLRDRQGATRHFEK